MQTRIKETYPIDIVVPWVDAGDPQWQAQRNKAAGITEAPTEDNADARFRDWDIIRYLFRGIQKHAPWVRTVHFITVGHLPKWMNTEAPGLRIVKHTDYIPEIYLPTFSSHTIELNMHRIPGLAEHFIYFNDDILIQKDLVRTNFFLRGLPRDTAVHTAMTSTHRFSVKDTALTNIELINDHFDKRKVIRENLLKWFNPVYGGESLKTLFLTPWNKFSDLQTWHSCVPFLKSTFDEVWNQEFEVLDSTCRHPFRTRRDVNQWLMRDWQLVKGDFIPISGRDSAYYVLGNDNQAAIEEIRRHRHSIVCLNDSGDEPIRDFEKTRKELIRALNKEFPEKSVYEK